MNRLKITFACTCVITLLLGCTKAPTVVPLSEVPLTLSAEPTVLKIEPPLLRVNRDLSIRIQMKEKWDAEPPWKDIRLQDGTKVTIGAVLISDTGAKYHPIVIGSAGSELEIRFDDTVPKDVKIVMIELTSTHPLTALKVKWVDWNPK